MVSIAGTLVGGIMRFLYTVTVGNTRSPAFLGAVSTAISTSMFANLLAPQGLANATTHFVARTSAERVAGEDSIRRTDAVAWYLWRGSVVAGLVVGAGAAALVSHVTDRGPWFSGSVALLTAAYAAYITGRAVQFSRFRSRRAVLGDVVSSVVALGFLALALVLHLDELVLIPLALGYSAAAATTRPPRVLGVERGLRREINRYAVLASVSALTSAGVIQLSMMVAGASVGPVEAGYYAAALSIATPLSMLAPAVTMVIMPAMSAAVGAGNDERLVDILKPAHTAVTALSLLGFGGLAVGASLVVSLLFPPAYAPAVLPLVVLTFAMLFVTIRTPPEIALTVQDSEGIRRTTVVGVISLIVAIISWTVTVPTLGTLGIAVGVLLSGATRFAGIAIVARRRGLRLAPGQWRLWVCTVGAFGFAVLAADMAVPHTLLLLGAFLLFWLALVGWWSRGAIRTVFLGAPGDPKQNGGLG